MCIYLKLPQHLCNLQSCMYVLYDWLLYLFVALILSFFLDGLIPFLVLVESPQSTESSPVFST